MYVFPIVDNDDLDIVTLTLQQGRPSAGPAAESHGGRSRSSTRGASQGQSEVKQGSNRGQTGFKADGNTQLRISTNLGDCLFSKWLLQLLLCG